MASCKYCTCVIIWERENSKWVPLEADGRRHQCKMIREIQKSKSAEKERKYRSAAKGRRVEREDEYGWQWLGNINPEDGEIVWFEIISPWITGERYQPTAHEPGCDAAPWERCECVDTEELRH